MSIYTALAAQRKRLAEKQEGFTLIELLVVVIIIGILAAIAIPVFLGQQQAAQNSAFESDLATAKVAYVSSLVEFPAGDAPEATLESFGFPTGTVNVSAGSNAAAFCLQHADAAWAVDESAEGPREGTCNAGAYVAP